MKSLSLWMTSKGCVGLGGLLALFLAIQALNFTGFCYSEVRYLTDREITHSGMFNSSAEQKQSDLAKLDCCQITGEPSSWSFWTSIINKLLGNYRYEVVSYLRGSEPHEISNEFFVRLVTVNSCGLDPYYVAGASVTREIYELRTNQIEQFWKDRME